MSLGESKGGLPPDECVEEEDAILRDCVRAVDRYHDPQDGAMTRVVLAPCSPFSVTTDLLTETAKLARDKNVMLHTHLCETLDEERYTLETYGKRPVDWMADLGWLGRDVWFAHAIHVSDSEISSFAHTGCGVAHCPCSNMRLGSGIAPVKKYMAAGVRVGIGVDGSASNDSSHMLSEVRQAMLLARLRLGLLPPEGPRDHFLLSQSHPLRAGEWMTAREVLELATLGGAAVLGRDDIGSLEAGKCADFFTLKLDSIGYAGGLNDPVAAVVFCTPQNAHMTVVQGRVVVENGEIRTVDMEPVVAEHNKWSHALATGV
jgi:cytosine/adenosine deaminase-related metal-dependent hydrolase